MFAALSTVEPPILDLVTVKILEGDRPWAGERLPLVKDRIRERLVQLSARLGDADWHEFPALAAYVARGEARPAYKRAFAAQLAVNQRP